MIKCIATDKSINPINTSLMKLKKILLKKPVIILYLYSYKTWCQNFTIADSEKNWIVSCVCFLLQTH